MTIQIATPVLGLSARAILAIVLLVAGLAKIATPRATAAIIRGLGISSERWARIAGLLLPILEITIGLGLTIENTALSASILAFLLFSLFTFVLSIAKLQGRVVDCGCFGKSRSQPNGTLAVGRAALFQATSALLALSHPSAQQLFGLQSEDTITVVVRAASFIFALGGLALVVQINSKPRSSSRTDRPLELDLRRRAFLKALASTIAALVLLRPGPAEAVTCRCQELAHYDPNCCSGSLDPYHIRHYYKRCCTSTGQVGYWHAYKPSSCECSCITMCSDVYYPCQGSACYPEDCSGCPR